MDLICGGNGRRSRRILSPAGPAIAGRGSRRLGAFAPFVDAAERFNAAARAYFEARPMRRPRRRPRRRESSAILCANSSPTITTALDRARRRQQAPQVRDEFARARPTREHQQRWQRIAEPGGASKRRSAGCNAYGPTRCAKRPRVSRGSAASSGRPGPPSAAQALRYLDRVRGGGLRAHRP